MKRMLTRWTEIFERLISQDSLPESWQRFLLVLIVLGVMVFRLLTINAPTLDGTQWKEIDYIMISTNYWKHGFNFLQPEATWPAEPPRVTEMEFPLVPFSAALGYQIFGFSVYTVRLVTLLAFLLLIIYVFKLAKRELGPFVGVTAAFAAGVMPLYHVFGRFLFTDPLMIAMSVVTLYYVAEWVDHKRRRDWFLALCSLSLTLALKLEALYLLLPILWIAFRGYGWHFRRYKGLLAFVFLALILPSIWYAYAYYLETTGAHLFGIFKGHNKSQTLTMLTSLGWYRAMLGRISRQILGGIVGVLLVIPGFVIGIRERRAHLFVVYLLANGVYFALVAEGQLDAPYRQWASIPPLSVFVALGATAFAAFAVVVYHSVRKSNLRQEKRMVPYQVIVLCLLGILLMPVTNHSVGYKGPIHWERWSMAQEIAKYTNEQSKLVTAGEYSIHVGGYDRSPVLYYYTGLQGWTLLPEDWNFEYVEALRRRGATHFVAMLPYGSPLIGLQEDPIAPFLEEMKERYPILYESQTELLLDLQQPKD